MSKQTSSNQGILPVLPVQDPEHYVSNRSELLFLYDVYRANPNGDPDASDRPRLDEDTGLIWCTDVRLKRTIRDYIADVYAGVPSMEIFIPHNEPKPLDAKFKEFTEKQKNGKKDDKSKPASYPVEILRRFIDVRLFGGVNYDSPSGSLIGPVQFAYGQSLHRPKINLVTLSCVAKSGEGKSGGTFGECYDVDYALIAFYGVINQYNARKSMLTERDVDILLEAMWNGTVSLLTRSKMSHVPRLLLRVVYQKDVNCHAGELNRLIKFVSKNPEQEYITDIDEGVLDITKLVKRLKEFEDVIEYIAYKIDSRLEVGAQDDENGFKTKPLEDILAMTGVADIRPLDIPVKTRSFA